MIAGSTPACAHDTMRASGVLPSLAASEAFISTTAAAPSLMPEALAAVTEPSLSKAGRSLAIESRVTPAFGYSSVSTTVSPLRRLDRHRRDLVLELAGLHRGLGLVLRLHRELVLLRAGDLPFLGDVLGGRAHVIAVEGIPQAVLDHGVDQLEAAHLHAVAQMLAVRRLAHRFLAAGDHDVAVAVEDGLVAERHRPQARAAELVHAPRGALDRNAGGDRGLAGRVLALTGGQDLAHDDLGDPAALDAGALERLLDRDLAQFMGRQAGKRPVERADRRAGRADDDDIVFHCENSLFCCGREAPAGLGNMWVL